MKRSPEEYAAKKQSLLSQKVSLSEKILGAKDPASRPAEYYVQVPDETICVEGYGIEVRLTGVSRSGRKAAQFHAALRDRKSVV